MHLRCSGSTNQKRNIQTCFFKFNSHVSHFFQRWSNQSTQPDHIYLFFNSTLNDASQNASVASKLLNPQAKAELVNELETEYEALREKSGLMKRETVSLEEAQKNKLNLF